MSHIPVPESPCKKDCQKRGYLCFKDCAEYAAFQAVKNRIYEQRRKIAMERDNYTAHSRRVKMQRRKK